MSKKSFLGFWGMGRRKRGSSKARRRGLLGIFGFFCYWGLVFGLWLTVGIVCLFVWYGMQLPHSDTWRVPDAPPNVRILADDGSLLLDRNVGRSTGGEHLALSDISPYLPQAVIAIEDRRFYRHFGFDIIGFARAMVRNLLSMELRQGGSTITQQLSKNLFLESDRTVRRKVQELILSFWLESRYTKDTILELYLNRVYFGSGAWGVDAASRVYFNKPPLELGLNESAILAGLLKAPSRYSPERNLARAEGRSRLVIAAMKREGFIDSEAYDSDELRVRSQFYRSGSGHYVADMVLRQVRDRLGEIDEDLVIHTTISPYMMAVAESSIGDVLDRYGDSSGVSQASLVSMSPDGAVRALIGGRDYSLSSYNRAVSARRQPGSSFKPFVWLSALEYGLDESTQLNDSPVSVNGWRPRNYNNEYRGRVSLRDAFAESLNTVSARLVRLVGAERVAATAHRLGVTSPLSANPSLALGTSEVSLLELTSAYAPIANGGFLIEPYIIRRIVSGDGDNIMYRRASSPPKRVVSPEVVAGMNRLFASVIESGTGRLARLDRHPSGGKTGTTQNFRDAWFVGYTSHLVTGVWYGNDDNTPMNGVTGGSLPARSWRMFMESSHLGLRPEPLPGDIEDNPDSIVMVDSAVGSGSSTSSTSLTRLLRRLTGG